MHTHLSKHTFIRFGIPIDLIEDSTSSVKMQSDKAKVLRESVLIVWDEGTVNDKEAYHVVDRLMRDIMKKQV